MDTVENTLLQNEVIISLFKNTYLVDLSVSQPANLFEKQQPQLLEVLAFHQFTETILPASQQNLLEAILQACKLTKEKVKVYSQQAITATPLQELLEKHQPKKILLFGVDPATIGLPMYFPIFQIQAFQQVQYLHAPNLSDLESDKQLKIQLWQKLKTLFP